MDGTDVAFVETDGGSFVRTGPCASYPYPEELRRTLLALPASNADIGNIERQITELQTHAVLEFCAYNRLALESVDIVGFHGQTISHDPASGRTLQLGDGQRMADALHVDVVNTFRQNDMDHGGQGAPLVPAFHRAIVQSSSLTQPVAVLNIGGVSNVTLIDGQRLHACDCGPGNALVDDWIRSRCGRPFDDGGKLARTGHVDAAALARLLDHPYFHQTGPKSLDRNAFSSEPVAALSPADGAATLSAFSAAAIAIEARRLPVRPRAWIVTGGGRHNVYLMDQLRERVGAPVITAEEVEWAGDALEAQAFAYLAARSTLGMPLSWPETTGVRHPVSGGITWRPLQGTTRTAT